MKNQGAGNAADGAVFPAAVDNAARAAAACACSGAWVSQAQGLAEMANAVIQPIMVRMVSSFLLKTM